jgi:hypothetical protein
MVHGGEAAVKALTADADLKGVALELQKQVSAEIDALGLVAVMRDTAERHLAVARLFHGLVAGATDIADADKFTKRFGWLNAKAFNMLDRLRQLEANTDALDYDELVKQYAGKD